MKLIQKQKEGKDVSYLMGSAEEYQEQLKNFNDTTGTCEILNSCIKGNFFYMEENDPMQIIGKFNR